MFLKKVFKFITYGNNTQNNILFVLHLVNYSNSVNIADDGSAGNGIQQGMEQAIF